MPFFNPGQNTVIHCTHKKTYTCTHNPLNEHSLVTAGGPVLGILPFLWTGLGLWFGTEPKNSEVLRFESTANLSGQVQFATEIVTNYLLICNYL